MCGIFCFLSTTTISEALLYAQFNKIKRRGPDISTFICKESSPAFCMGFHRLCVQDLSMAGNQPFVSNFGGKVTYTMCNGEIYNWIELADKYYLNNKSKSDCEVLHHLFIKIGFNDIGMNKINNELDGEYSLIILEQDRTTNEITIYCARDHLGIRPLFLGKNNGQIGLASEMKALHPICNDIQQFPPRCWAKFTINNNQISSTTVVYKELIPHTLTEITPLEKIYGIVRYFLTQAIRMRLLADREIGFLLSGGLDSSLICCLATQILRETNPSAKIRTFSIGMPHSPDIHYAEIVAKHIGSDHTVIKFDEQEALAFIPEVVKTIETFDITTVRASTPHMLIAKWISEHTNIRVLMTGEVSDELSNGYLYSHNIPTAELAHKDALVLLNEIHYFDVLRGDRSISRWGMEARVPFSDKQLLSYYLSIDPALRMPRPSTKLNCEKKLEKALLREIFSDILPKEVTLRSKDGFSDSCSPRERSWYQIIQDHCEKIITTKEFEKERTKYSHLPPHSKEAYWYRKLFCEYYGDANSSNILPHFWLPKYSGDITDPSARALPIV